MTQPQMRAQMRQRAATGRRLIWPVLICLLAFLLRINDLDGQSMWSDEGLSYYRAQLSTAQILANTITVDGVRTVDTNPPFYFLLLHAWRALIGHGVYQLRLMGVAAGLLAAPLMVVLGRALFERRVGLLAGLLLAVSPLHVWQTQTLRNYGLLLTLNLLSFYGLARLLTAPEGSRRGKWLALWLAAGLLGIYTHYFAFFVFAFTLAAFVLDLLWARRGRWPARRALVGLALALALLSPALWAAFDRFRAGRQFDFAAGDPWGIVQQAASVFSVGMSPVLSHPWPWLIPALLLFAGGIVLGWRTQPRALALLLAYQIVPLGLLLALSTINPLINGTRHLLIGLPPFLLLCAILPGMLWASAPARPIAARLALLLALAMIIIQVIWLQRQFNHADFVRDDVRGAAHYLSQMARPQDTIVLHDTLLQFTFDAYYQGAAPVVAAPLFGRHDEAEAIARLQQAGAPSQRVWLLTHPQPRTGFARDLLPQWAEAHWPRLATVSFDWMWLPLRLRTYSPQPAVESLPLQATALAAAYENGLALHGYQMPAALQSGAPFIATFYLSRAQEAAPGENVEISLRFLDGQGRLWRQIDQPLWPAYPLAQWPAATLLRYDHITALPVGLPPGDYQVWLRLVNREENRNLSLAGGGLDLRLSDMQVSAAPCEPAAAPWPGYQQVDALFGGSLLLKGHGQAAERYLPGHLLAIDLLWCVLRPPAADVRLQARLLDSQGAIVAEAQGALTREEYPAAAWQANELLQGRAQLPLPSSLQAGAYTLQLSVLSGERPLPANLGLGGRAVTIAHITVDEWPRQSAFPPIATPARADFGQPTLIELHGYELGAGSLAPGESTSLTLYWLSAVAFPAENYYVFVHLIQEGQPPLAQADGPPLDGFRPTSSWREGELFVDQRTLTIPPDAAEGRYALTLGFYNPDSFVRLPAFVDGEQQPQDTVFLQWLAIQR